MFKKKQSFAKSAISTETPEFITDIQSLYMKPPDDINTSKQGSVFKDSAEAMSDCHREEEEKLGERQQRVLLGMKDGFDKLVS